MVLFVLSHSSFSRICLNKCAFISQAHHFLPNRSLFYQGLKQKLPLFCIKVDQAFVNGMLKVTSNIF
eukprot:c26782_g1_i1 orf=254-454(+)